MAEYIDKTEVVNKLIRLENYYQFYKEKWDAEVIYRRICELEIGIGKTPAADVAEVRHGRWEKFRLGEDDYILRLRCSCCRKVVYEREFNYCPNCGADMRGADNGE